MSNAPSPSAPATVVLVSVPAAEQGEVQAIWSEGAAVRRASLPAALATRLVRATSSAGGVPPRAADELIAWLRDAAIAAPAPAPDSTIRLTPRERQVLSCLVDGLSYKQIAYELDIGIETVRTYIRSLYRKLDVHCVAEAVSLALRTRLVAA